MKWDQIQGRWIEYANAARAHWGQLTDDDWEAITGTKGHLVGRVQKRYGISWKEAEKQVDEWTVALQELGPVAEASDAPIA